MTVSASSNLAPPPSSAPIVNPKDGMGTWNWIQWFVAARVKINAVNASLANLAGTSGTPGILVTDGNGNWFVRALAAGTNVTITDADGVAGDPTISATGGGGSSSLSINIQTITSYTLQSTDSGSWIDMQNSSKNTVTIPLNSTTPLPIGAFIYIGQGGPGTTLVTAAPGVTITGSSVVVGAQNNWCGLVQVSTNQWRLFGDIFWHPYDPYGSIVLGDNPVVYWKLNETSGTIAIDYSGNGYNATYVNSPTLAGGNITANTGAAVLLNGSSQYTELSTVPTALQLTSGSFECWVDFSTTPNGTGIFCSAYNTSAVNFAIATGSSSGATSGSYLYGGGYTGSSWNAAISTITPAVNTAYHIVYVNNGTNVYLYINGALAATGSISTFTANANPIYIGRRWDNTGVASFLSGLISNVAIYNYALTATQVLNHYNAGK